MSHHSNDCRPPAIGQGTVPMQPDWTCGVCGRVWRDMRLATGLQWWAEVRGPCFATKTLSNAAVSLGEQP